MYLLIKAIKHCYSFLCQPHKNDAIGYVFLTRERVCIWNMSIHISAICSHTGMNSTFSYSSLGVHPYCVLVLWGNYNQPWKLPICTTSRRLIGCCVELEANEHSDVRANWTTISLKMSQKSVSWRPGENQRQGPDVGRWRSRKPMGELLLTWGEGRLFVLVSRLFVTVTNYPRQSTFKEENVKLDSQL